MQSVRKGTVAVLLSFAWLLSASLDAQDPAALQQAPLRQVDEDHRRLVAEMLFGWMIQVVSRGELPEDSVARVASQYAISANDARAFVSFAHEAFARRLAAGAPIQRRICDLRMSATVVDSIIELVQIGRAREVEMNLTFLDELSTRVSSAAYLRIMEHTELMVSTSNRHEYDPETLRNRPAEELYERSRMPCAAAEGTAAEGTTG